MNHEIYEETSGGSRSTWRLASGDWLTGCAVKDAGAFRKETALLQTLRNEFANAKTSLAVPEVLLSTTGETVVEQEGFLWRVTKNIPGSKIAANDFRTHPALIRALDEFHSAIEIRQFKESTLEVGVLGRLSRFSLPADMEPFFREVWNWLNPRLTQLEKFPITVTHGDFNPTNVIYSNSSDCLTVTGILDFELSRPDPAIMDYSQLLTMIVCHSGSAETRAMADQYLSSLYSRFGHSDLCVAMVAYWVELYLRWKHEPIAEARIRMRIGQIRNHLVNSGEW
jgi:Ser/Thr protein kinase RdoA (MazF antagonist)